MLVQLASQRTALVGGEGANGLFGGLGLRQSLADLGSQPCERRGRRAPTGCSTHRPADRIVQLLNGPALPQRTLGEGEALLRIGYGSEAPMLRDAEGVRDGVW